MTKYEYLFDVNDKLVHHSEAIRLNEYRLYPGEPLDYIYKQGDEREYFAKKIETTNVFGLIGLKESGVYGESAEHYNAKMKSEKIFECENCKLKMDRDINSCRNIIMIAL